MYYTLEKLRLIKHSLPTGSIKKLASQFDIEEQTVRNYFGARKFKDGKNVGIHIQPGPSGGVVHLNDPSIVQAAESIAKLKNVSS